MGNKVIKEIRMTKDDPKYHDYIREWYKKLPEQDRKAYITEAFNAGVKVNNADAMVDYIINRDKYQKANQERIQKTYKQPVGSKKVQDKDGTTRYITQNTDTGKDVEVSRNITVNGQPISIKYSPEAANALSKATGKQITEDNYFNEAQSALNYHGKKTAKFVEGMQTFANTAATVAGGMALSPGAGAKALWNNGGKQILALAERPLAAYTAATDDQGYANTNKYGTWARAMNGVRAFLLPSTEWVAQGAYHGPKHAQAAYNDFSNGNIAGGAANSGMTLLDFLGIASPWLGRGLKAELVDVGKDIRTVTTPVAKGYYVTKSKITGKPSEKLESLQKLEQELGPEAPALLNTRSNITTVTGGQDGAARNLLGIYAYHSGQSPRTLWNLLKRHPERLSKNFKANGMKTLKSAMKHFFFGKYGASPDQIKMFGQGYKGLEPVNEMGRQGMGNQVAYSAAVNDAPFTGTPQAAAEQTLPNKMTGLVNVKDITPASLNKEDVLKFYRALETATYDMAKHRSKWKLLNMFRTKGHMMDFYTNPEYEEILSQLKVNGQPIFSDGRLVPNYQELIQKAVLQTRPHQSNLEHGFIGVGSDSRRAYNARSQYTSIFDPIDGKTTALASDPYKSGSGMHGATGILGWTEKAVNWLLPDLFRTPTVAYFHHGVKPNNRGIASASWSPWGGSEGKPIRQVFKLHNDHSTAEERNLLKKIKKNSKSDIEFRDMYNSTLGKGEHVIPKNDELMWKLEDILGTQIPYITPVNIANDQIRNRQN